jgi:3-hydroxyacyl-CoA dehydrogenase / enoyl-CoA hydratase / 3-hydroxybutyryl-CoA epimerase
MTEPAAWQLTRAADGIATLTLDRPGSSANSLGRAVLQELGELLKGLQAQPPRGLIICSGKKSGFIAGADIREFTTLRTQAEALELIRGGQKVCDQLAALPCPTVAAIHGFAMGGGLELALACRYRVGADDGRLSLGLPEVQLGIHPGFGGTVRSVQLVGMRAAMALMLAGKPVRADRALATGLVDRLVAASELDASARRLITEAPRTQRPPFVDRLLNLPVVRAFMRGKLEAQVARHARREHYPAPYAIIDLWVKYGARGRAAYDAEAESIAHLFTTTTARSLVRVFLLQDRLKALGGKSATPIKRVHVIGAGVMGGDIAAWCALRGLEVTLQDREQARCSTSGSRIRASARRHATASRPTCPATASPLPTC